MDQLPSLEDLIPSPFTFAVFALCASLYYYYNRSFMGAWEGLGVPGPKYEFLLGYYRVVNKGEGLMEIVKALFDRYGKNVASYDLVNRKPVLSTYDVKVLKHVLVKDFSNFVDRGGKLHSKSDLEKGLFFIGGSDWRRIRTQLTPIFSSGKLKQMLGHVNQSGLNLGRHWAKQADRKKQIGVKQECGHYTSELIAILGFGLSPNAVGKEEDCEFTIHTQNLVQGAPASRLFYEVLGVIVFFLPASMTYLYKLRVIPDTVHPKADTFFTDLTETTIAQKKTEGAKKVPDFLDLMLSCGEIESTDNTAPDGSGKGITHSELIGQCKLLMFAGFETTSTTFSMCLYELAKHPEIQQKVFEEIQETVAGDNPTYEELQKLKYTEQVINETLRLFPPLRSIERTCKTTKTYDGFTIPGDSRVFVHIWKVHMDPDHWVDPEKFDPDRFTEEEKAKRDPLAFMPFGFGPRLCIGQRLALQKLKVGLVHVLRHVKFALTENTEPKLGEELMMNKNNPFVVPEKPIMLEATRRGTQ